MCIRDREYALLDTLSNAEENAEKIRNVVKLIRQHADILEKKTQVASTMLDDKEIRRYLEIVIIETGAKENRGEKG